MTVRLYSYVVARDYGFAPNPFHGVCTLATCKPRIRESARAGDWIVGTGAASYGLNGHLVFAMLVEECLSYTDYWDDPRFVCKRPNLRKSLKHAYGDNIYHRDSGTGRWAQENSHHSSKTGRRNFSNIRHDTQTDRVLVSWRFAYWGGHGPRIPARYRDYRGNDVCAHRGHKCRFPEKMIDSFVRWLEKREEAGYVGAPAEFSSRGGGG